MKRMLLLLSLALPLSAAATEYAAKLVRVLDGDTLIVDIDREVWTDITATVRVTIRLDGVNAPEIHSRLRCEHEAGVKALQFTQAFVNKGPLTVDVLREEKFGRTLAKVSAGGKDLATELIAAGLGRRYAGERRGAWCVDEVTK